MVLFIKMKARAIMSFSLHMNAVEEAISALSIGCPIYVVQSRQLLCLLHELPKLRIGWKSTWDILKASVWWFVLICFGIKEEWNRKIVQTISGWAADVLQGHTRENSAQWLIQYPLISDWESGNNFRWGLGSENECWNSKAISV